YMEAELNSPMCRLRPGEECGFDTEWFPTRGGRDIRGVTEAGTIVRALRAIRADNNKVKLTGCFGAFYKGQLIAHFYDGHGAKLGVSQVADVVPTELVNLQSDVAPGGKAARVSLHLMDQDGVDRGPLQEVRVDAGDGH